MSARTLIVTLRPTGMTVEVDRPTITVGRLAEVAPTLGAKTTAPPRDEGASHQESDE